jgi:putative (di)nucleoside polyphosphate hydrolase
MTETYRPNVAAFIVDQDFNFLFCERRDRRGFQLPQGGIEKGESVEEALARELKEETHITNFQILAKAPETVKYKFSPDFVNKDVVYVGQEQTYFLVQISDEEKSHIKETEEFIDFRWTTIEAILSNVVEFKKDVTRKAWDLLKAEYQS